MPNSPTFVVSIVSHGHGPWVKRLLSQLNSICPENLRRVIVTHNLPDENFFEWGGLNEKVEFICNSEPLGFSSNHNKALLNAKEDWVCILNPDVQLINGQNPFSILSEISENDLGCIYPFQVDENNKVQESERELLTPWSILRRKLLRKKQRKIDWVNGAFLLIPTEKWHAVGGFDTRYFMYCEDVDLSLRLQLKGWHLKRNDTKVIHAGQHASMKHWRPFLWHVKSMLRLWTSQIFWSYLIRNLKKSNSNI